ncbi:WYL domain-containing protein [Vibrio parahaemolyticus]|uniref:WYL domain-containing protein n=1 Tax=Vibrio parahaemolyticus TaxID=670 RepID=UPI000404BBF6|nr:hypothetical protein [Vibrio parahaemolyticus]
MGFVGWGLIGLIALAFYWVRKAKKTMNDPVKFREYVTQKGYNEEQQKDFCKRLGIDYEKVTAKTEPTPSFEPTHKSKAAAPLYDESLEQLTPRRMKALYKLANQILEDEVVDLAESKKLLAWFNRYPESKEDPRTQRLAVVVKEYLSDKVLDHDEALHLFSMLTDFCDDFERQEQELKKPKVTVPPTAKRINIAKGSGFSFVNDLTLGNEYFMSYRDASGQVSDRNIILTKVDSNANGDTYIKAHCLMRDALRTFRADRITGLCCVETGEAFV